MLPQAGLNTAPDVFSRIEAGAGKASVTVRILVPKSAPTIAPRFVSPATKSLLIKVSLKGKLVQTVGVNLNARNRNCKNSSSGLKCSQKLSLAIGKYTASFSTYSGAIAKGKPTGKLLSADQRLPLNVPSKGLSVAINDDLAGIPAKVAFIPSSGSILSGSQTSGYVLSRCSINSQQVDVVGVDAAGYEILGAGAPKPSLTSSDRSALAVSGPGSNSYSNTFTLTLGSPLPAAGTTVVLTASEKPLAAAGGKAVRSKVNVMLSNFMCVTRYPVTVNGYAIDGISSIVAGPDGNLWFTFNYGGGQVARLNPATGAITEFATPVVSSSTLGIGIEEITNGPGGQLWVTGNCQCLLSVTTSGKFTVIPITLPQAYTYCEPDGSPFDNIATGSDQKVYFDVACPQGDLVGIYDPTAGTQTFATIGGSVTTLATGPDGNVWYADDTDKIIGKITSDGQITRYSAMPQAQGLAAGPDGKLWYTAYGNFGFGSITTLGKVTNYPFDQSYSSGVGSIVEGPDANLWFAATSTMNRTTTTGVLSRFQTGYGSGSYPPQVSTYHTIAVGSDGNLWYIDGVAGGGSAIDRFQLQ
ncbi:MAG TPA: hypothetical protein VNF68_11350 [Candidatus Baltobacteraceae bacterium]|nr:hypothetical protein [Candidatus Baltobacteraceae bacterium]